MKSIPRFGRGSARVLPTHRDQGLEIILLEKGALNWHVEGRVERVTAGSVYFSLPWQEHGSVDEFEPGHYWHWVQIGLDGGLRRPRETFGFHPAFGIGPAEARRISGLLTRSGRHCYPATPRMRWLLPVVVEELAHPGAHSPGYCHALVRLAVFELVRSIEAGPAEGAAAASERRVADFIGRLRERSAETWALEHMADQCGLGRSRFATLCRRLTGDSPLVLVNRLRIDRAKRALKETEASVTDIALACGFNSSQYFARVFRHFTGLDARGYRQRHRPGR
ncbi:MAG: helix-turn-helix transcriptional regulator [Verrucomicrobia bacterium]|nr:helix-turn-helix transcriptional regulator [Verrucomicrobiota bacterium]